MAVVAVVVVVVVVVLTVTVTETVGSQFESKHCYLAGSVPTPPVKVLGLGLLVLASVAVVEVVAGSEVDEYVPSLQMVHHNVARSSERPPAHLATKQSLPLRVDRFKLGMKEDRQV